MNFYIEITLLPNPDINLFSLWSKTFQQIHLASVEMQDDLNQVPVGISFPEYVIGEKYSVLGGKCRLFALDEATLVRFDASKWLSRLSDYVHCTGIRPVPEKLEGYANYRRLQPKTNKERLARRYAVRHQVDYEEALKRYGEMAAVNVPMPFIRINSLSNGRTFCLWINKTPATEPQSGTFSTYGLSSSATVPEF